MGMPKPNGLNTNSLIALSPSSLGWDLAAGAQAVNAITLSGHCHDKRSAGL
jgi:hypothetical protein